MNTLPNGQERELLYDGLDDALKLKLKERIFELISKEGCETFAEIQSHNIEDFGGDYLFTWEHRPDLVLWSGLSKESIAAFTELLVEKKIFPHPCHFLAYVYDGGALRLPIAKGASKRYKKQHWLPIMFKTRPMAMNPRKK